MGDAGAQLPTLGDTTDLTVAAERKLGDSIVRSLYRDADYIDDPLLGEYVQGVWDQLRAAGRVRGELPPELDERFAWTVLLGRDRTVNAFALPGGFIGVHLGLVGLTTSRDEVASVLAHEMSHVTQRHIARMLSQQSRMGPLMIGAMVLGALAASKNPQLGGALMTGGQAAALQNQLNFSRDMEREADRIGYGVMEQAGFAPIGFVTMFEKLQQASRINDNGSFPYLRSHPLTNERIADMQSRQQLASASAATAAPALEHAMLAARARALSDRGVDGLRAAVAEADAAGLAAQPVERQAGARYGAAVAQLRQRNIAQARAQAAALDAALRRKAPDAAALRLSRLLSAEIALAGNDAAGALGVLGVAPSTERRPELLLAARAVAALPPAPAGPGVVDGIVQRLRAWLALHPRDAGVWQALASAYQRQGPMAALPAVRAEGEAQAALYDFAAARDRFKAAQDMARRAAAPADHIEVSIVDTRLREVEALLREQAAER